MKMIITFVLMLLLLPTARAVYDYCQDNQTLVHNNTYYYCPPSSAVLCGWHYDIAYEPCKFGCDTQLNVCKSAPYITTLQVMGGVVGFVIFILIVLKLMGRI